MQKLELNDRVENTEQSVNNATQNRVQHIPSNTKRDRYTLYREGATTCIEQKNTNNPQQENLPVKNEEIKEERQDEREEMTAKIKDDKRSDCFIVNSIVEAIVAAVKKNFPEYITIVDTSKETKSNELKLQLSKKERNETIKSYVSDKIKGYIMDKLKEKQ